MCRIMAITTWRVTPASGRDQAARGILCQGSNVERATLTGLLSRQCIYSYIVLKGLK